MKKAILIILSSVLASVLVLVAYFYIWGGKPQIENIEEASDDYQAIARGQRVSQNK